MPKKNIFIIIGILIIILGGGYYLITQNNSQTTSNNSQTTSPSSQINSYDEFAQCLTQKGVKMYGAYWCPHCNNQKEMFGSSWQYIDYVKCALRNSRGQTPSCREAGIRAYPTWVFPDGRKIEGELSFKELSEYSGCQLPSKT